MKKIMKSLLVFVAMVVLCLAASFSTNALAETGQCGENVYWNYNSTTKELIITGNGPMNDYNSTNPPFGLSDIKTVVIKNGVTRIGKYAFGHCYDLINITIPDTVKSIGDSAFKNCQSLVSIKIPDDVTSIGGSVFYSCVNLKSVTIPNSVTSIGPAAFYACSGLSNVTIPNSVVTIGEAAFSECDNLTSITIPDSVTSIGDYAFAVCWSLRDVYYYGTENQWNQIRIGEYNDNLTNARIHFLGKEEHIHTPVEQIVAATCTTAGERFYVCSGCHETIGERVVIPASNHANATTDPGKAPTATEVGYTAGKYCPDCKIWIEGHKEIPLLHVHSYTSKITKQANCTDTGIKTYTCTCGDTHTETIPATNHANATTDEGKAPTETEVGYTAGKYCPDCETWLEGHIEIPKLEAHVHSYTSTITTEPTCTTAGTTTFTCTCGDTYIESIPATNHANATTDAGKEPTETEVGYTAGKYCPDCETWLEGHIEIPKLEAHVHSYTSTITTEPTCTTAGTTAYTCTCGDSYTETIPATNHANATTDAGKEPTTTEVGYTAGKYCPDCKTWIEGHEEIPMLHTHTYTPTVTKEATCWREGEKTYTCTCGDSYTEAIAKLDHEYRPWETKKNPTCTAPGLEWSYCLLCDNDFEREIPATGHTIIDYTRRATPDSDGAYVTACDVCNEVFKSISFGRPAEYKLSTTKYTYDGKTKTPKLTVETSDGVVLKEGVDYELELPSGRKVVGVYTYRVVFKGNFLGEKKVSYQILPGKTTSVSATQSIDSIKLTWKKVTGADGYRVYQYNSKTGKYEAIKTLTGTSYTVKKLKAGTSYKFAVKAYSKADGETLWASSYKTITTTTKPATPTLKATAGSKQATISWKKVTGATGYVVYMQDEFGDYEKIGTTKNTSYTRKKLTKGETYYFRVRAYKTVDGKNIYGGYKTVKVKVK